MDLQNSADEVQNWKNRLGLIDVNSFSKFWCEQSISSEASTNVISAFLALYMGKCTIACMLVRLFKR